MVVLGVAGLVLGVPSAHSLASWLPCRVRHYVYASPQQLGRFPLWNVERGSGQSGRNVWWVGVVFPPHPIRKGRV